MEFDNVLDLYKRVEPALQTKLHDLERIGIYYIKKQDIWNYLIVTKWKNSVNLALSDIVNDILSLDNNVINDYVLNNLKDMKRKVTSLELDIV